MVTSTSHAPSFLPLLASNVAILIFTQVARVNSLSLKRGTVIQGHSIPLKFGYGVSWVEVRMIKQMKIKNTGTKANA